MTITEFDKCLNSYSDRTNDYRYVFNREQIKEIKEALELKNKELDDLK